MSTTLLRALALWTIVILAVACAPPPPPTIVAGGPSQPPLAVAVGPAEPARTDADEPFVDDPDPGPVPVRAGDPWWGRRDAPVTIVEFADFQCPFCARVTGTLGELRARYGPDKLRIVWKHLPLPFHPHAKTTAIVSTLLFERFGNRGFWDAHDAFFAGQKDLPGALEREAAKLGLSPEDIAEMAKGREGERLDAATAEANKVGARGTPAFLINGVFLSGSQPVDKFAAIVEEQLAKASALAARGVPRGRVYAELTKTQWKPPPPPSSSPSAPPDEKTVHFVPVGKSPVRGKPTALVTIVEFAEFQCPFCGRVEQTLAQILAKYPDDVRLVWKHQPLPFHPRAVPAAIFSAEARAQRGDAGFWKAHDLLFKRECAGDPQATTQDACEANANNRWVDNQRHLEQADLLAYAAALKLNVAAVTAALAGKTHEAAILLDQELADDVQASGTPHFFINGRRLVGAQPVEKFVAMIDEELAKARDMVKGGVRPAQVYDRIMDTAKKPVPPEKKTVAPPPRDAPSRGPANAKVVVQYFGDLQCPFCARAHATIAELERAFPGKIRIVWRHLPLPFHTNAAPAAEAAMEGLRQKGDPTFWSMVDAMYANQRDLDRPGLERLAAQQGLDPVRFVDALDTHAHRAAIDADAKAAEAAGISGTPAFVINGYFVSGAQPFAKFKKVVTLALQGK